MYRSVLVGYDGRDSGRDAIALGASMARITGAQLTVAYIYISAVDWNYPPGHGRKLLLRNRELLHESAERVLEQVEPPADGAVEIIRLAEGSTSPARGLNDLAERRGEDLIVVGSTSRGPFGRALIGSTGERLLHGAPCPVAVAPRGQGERPDEIGVVGVAYGGSEEAEAALAAGEQLALAAGASLRLITVVEEPATYVGALGSVEVPAGINYAELHAVMERDLRVRLDDAVARVSADVGPHGILASGDPAEVLEAETVRGLDVLAMGSRGYGTLRGVVLGAVSAKLTRLAACPVIVYPRSAVSN
jgi:nucleotide-binding universal stress UspA family protein